MRKLAWIGLFALGGCLGGNDGSSQNTQAQRTQNEEPDRPPATPTDPTDPDPGEPPVGDPCWDAQNAAQLCLEQVRPACESAHDALGQCYAQGYAACAAEEEAMWLCFEAQMQGGTADDCADEREALGICQAGIVPPDCSSFEQAVQACYAPCEQLLWTAEELCRPPEPPPPPGGGTCEHLYLALHSCYAEAVDLCLPTGMDQSDPMRGCENRCGIIEQAIAELCPQPCDEPGGPGGGMGGGEPPPDPRDPSDPHGGMRPGGR
jgi:hypothetical protein